jgi:hypothetical protein
LEHFSWSGLSLKCPVAGVNWTVVRWESRGVMVRHFSIRRAIRIKKYPWKFQVSIHDHLPCRPLRVGLGLTVTLQKETARPKQKEIHNECTRNQNPSSSIVTGIAKWIYVWLQRTQTILKKDEVGRLTPPDIKNC